MGMTAILLAFQLTTSSPLSAFELHDTLHPLGIFQVCRALPLVFRAKGLSIYELNQTDWADPDPDHPNPYGFWDWQGIGARFVMPEIVLHASTALKGELWAKCGLVAYYRYLTAADRMGWTAEGFAVDFASVYQGSATQGLRNKIRGLLGPQAPGYEDVN